MIRTSTFFSHFFFFNDTATTEIYTLSLHDALPISVEREHRRRRAELGAHVADRPLAGRADRLGAGAEVLDDLVGRSEEHTSELQSLAYLVCRLLLEKKKKRTTKFTSRLASS